MRLSLLPCSLKTVLITRGISNKIIVYLHAQNRICNELAAARWRNGAFVADCNFRDEQTTITFETVDSLKETVDFLIFFTALQISTVNVCFE